MRNKAIVAVCTLALVAACRAGDQANEAATSNNLIQSAETRSAAAVPLNREQALALMKERHDGMEQIGDETKRVTNQLKSASPDVAAIQQSAAKIAELAPKAQTWFPEGTGPDVGKTRAKAEIWQKPEDFLQKAQDFERTAQAFNAAAQSGDLQRIRSSFADLGKTCKACHDSYRSPEDDH